MAGNSFSDGRFPSRCVNLEHVSRNLQLNPYPRSRNSSPAICDEVLGTTWLENPLEHAQRQAEIAARPLIRFHQGRVFLDAEEPGVHSTDPTYWVSRAAYFRVEYEKLLEEEYLRVSRSKTPEIDNPYLYEDECDRAKCYAENAARLLLRLPAGKASIEAEDYENSTRDAAYWWRKKKLYDSKLEALSTITEIETAKRAADLTARDLATFPSGKAFLESEGRMASAEAGAKYWQGKNEEYQAKCRKFEDEFWDRWKIRCLQGGSSESNRSSDPRNGAGRSSAIKRTSTRITKSTIQGRKATRRVPLVPASSSLPSRTSLEMMKMRRSATESRGSHKLESPSQNKGRKAPLVRAQTLHPTASSQILNTPRVPSRYERKCGKRQKRRRYPERTYRGSKLQSQPIEPISSRLRSSERY